ncbi:MAG: serine hydrolase domain-containing protein [Gemmatimonadales bacterium]
MRLSLRTALALSLVAGAVPVAAAAQHPEPPRTQNSELRTQNPELSAALAARIDSLFAPFEKPGSPGCALGLVRDGRLVYARGYGLASIELGVPIAPTTVFDIGSTSKQVTATAILLLERDGVLSLDDDVRRWVPELPDPGARITVRHLLHHTSGLRDYIDLLHASGVPVEAVTGPRHALEILSRQRGVNFAAGAEYAYSNTGFFLLSVIVERAGGRTLRAFADERIFRPLDMGRSFFLDDHAEPVPGKASSYEPRRGGGFALSSSNWEQTGDGAVQTTVLDLLAWDRNFSGGPVGDSALRAKLETPGRLNDGRAIDYGLGLVIDTYRGLRRVSHGGAWAGFRAELLRFPEARTSVICLCNLSSSGPTGLARRVADIVLAERFTAPAPGPGGPRVTEPDSIARRAPLPVSAYAGAYHSDELLADWRVTAAGDSLRVRVGLVESAVTRTAGDRFRSDLGTITFERDAAGRVIAARLLTRGVRGLRLARVPESP